MGFWTSTLSNFLATVGGVLVGLPIALWVNRSALSAGERARRDSEREEIDHSLHLLEMAIPGNVPRLDRLRDVVAKDDILFDIGLDTWTWAATQPTLSAELTNPVLRQKLANHFSRLAAVERLNERLLDASTTASAAMASAPATRQALKSALSSAALDLRMEALEFDQLIEGARESLGRAYTDTLLRRLAANRARKNSNAV